MTITQEQADWFAQTFGQIADNVERAVLGKRHVVELVLTAMLSDGHVLLEDVPGTGKTSLAPAMAQSVLLSAAAMLIGVVAVLFLRRPSATSTDEWRAASAAVGTGE